MAYRNLRPGLLAILLLAALPLAGCGGASRQRLAEIQADFNAGNYQQAYRRAMILENTPPEPMHVKQSAAYLAGLSAYRLGDRTNAYQHLEFAARSRDPQLRTRAQAMLGLVYNELGRFDEAARNLLAAADGLEGEEKARAYQAAGTAQQRLGRWASARSTLSLALSQSRDEAFRRRVGEQLRATGYTLQTGAYQDQGNAVKAAEELASKAVSLQMGPPRVVPATDPTQNRRLYLVQVGEFASWQTAQMARERLGVTQAIPVPLSQPPSPRPR